MKSLLHNMLLCVLLLASINLYSQEPQQESLAQLYERVKTSVVFLDVVLSSIKEENNPQGELLATKVENGGVGSGFLIEDDLILTAAHVVHQAEKINVLFIDGLKRTGKVVSSDIYADLSLVRLDKKHPKFKPVVMGDSDRMRIGDPVFVIGAPYEVPFTLTRGIISGVHQPGSHSDYNRSQFFQSDASLNPGNSGGPMFNIKGEVIGIASFIKTNSGGSEGLGFAVTSNSAKKNMINKPHFYSGLTFYYIKGRLAQALNIPQKGGLLVQNVIKGSSADHFGIKGGNIKVIYNNEPLLIGGDVILSIAGIPLINSENIKRVEQKLLDLVKNKTYNITLLRHGHVSTIKWQHP